MTTPARRCPECAAALEPRAVGAIAIDVCACDGIWFDRDELHGWRSDRTDDLTGARPIDPQPSAPSPCPRCVSKALLWVARGPRRAARCAACQGIWLPAATVRQCQPHEIGWWDAFAASAPEAILQILFGLSP